MADARPGSGRSRKRGLVVFTGFDPLVRFYLIAGCIILVAGCFGFLHAFLSVLIVSAIAVGAGTIAYLGVGSDREDSADANRWSFLRQSLIRDTAAGTQPDVR